MPISCSAALTSSATDRCGAWAISFQNTAPAPVWRASSVMIAAAGPRRSNRRVPAEARAACRDRSDCASHQRDAPPSGRAGGARSGALASSRT
jgi:hypothetical protein